MKVRREEIIVPKARDQRCCAGFFFWSVAGFGSAVTFGKRSISRMFDFVQAGLSAFTRIGPLLIDAGMHH
jgi:hypothetical protein